MKRMFEEKLDLIKSLISHACKTLDSFDDINMPEHLNEPLCFVSVKSYKSGDMLLGSSSDRYYDARAKIVIDVLGARNMSAKELSEIVDQNVLSAVGMLGFSVYSLERKPCEFSKLHFRHVISLEFEIDAAIPASVADGITVTVDGEDTTCFSSYDIDLGVRTSVAPLSNGSMLSSIVCPEPIKIRLFAKLSSSDASSIITRFKGYLGATHKLTVGDTTYQQMALVGLKTKMQSVTVIELTAEFSEVNE